MRALDALAASVPGNAAAAYSRRRRGVLIEREQALAGMDARVSR